jgi:hypothetical protein
VETFRKILDGLFKIVAVLVFTAIVLLLSLGAFPININPTGQKVKFDIAYFGWEQLKNVEGNMEITHKPDEFKEGIGALKYSYVTNSKYPPGIRSEAYPIEGLSYFEFWMKSQHPSNWQVQIKRKGDGRIFSKTFAVGREWKQYNIHFNAIVAASLNTGESSRAISAADFDTWVTFVDISHKKYPQNTIWIDDIFIYR